MIFSAAERQMWFLETYGHSFPVTIPDEWDVWLRRYMGGDEVIFKDQPQINGDEKRSELENVY